MVKDKGVYRVIILPDMQVPYEDKDALAVVEAYMADHKWDEWLCLGDFLDFDCISKFNEEAFRNVENKRIHNDYEDGNKILDRHQAIIRKNNPKAKFTLLEGNHEYRVERLVDKYPVLEGSVEVEHGLRLKEREIKWVRCYKSGDTYQIGNAFFHHGLYANKYHANKMVDNFGVNIYYGHTHDVMSFPKVLRGREKTLEGHSLGCLCKYDQSYIKNNPSNWQQAFAVGYFFPDGYYNIYVTRIFKHRFISPEGKVYQKK